MGMNTALKNRQILENAHAVIGVELMAALIRSGEILDAVEAEVGPSDNGPTTPS